MPSFREQLDRAIADREDEPWLRILEKALPSETTIVSTRTLHELLGLGPGSVNAWRIARAMRALGFLPHRSRRLVPGGFRDTAARGWVRPKPIE